MKQYLQKIMAKDNLTQGETSEAFDLIMSGQATPAQIGAFLVGLRMKGETVDEIAGGASSMRKHAVFIDCGGLPVIDTCGTGGDGRNTFNISTTAAFIVAGAGVPVAKHGNRGVTSKCGSADLLAELGVNIEALPETVENCVREAGIGFLFAPKLHPAMKHAMGPRKELGVRTIFNMLGPLTNPAGAKSQIIGVFSSELTEPFANVLKLLGSRRAFIVHGHDRMDEITTTTVTRVSELSDGRVKTYDLDPIQFIGEYTLPRDLNGGDPAVNADITRKILSGEKGPRRDIACINAAAAIVAGGKAQDIGQGWKLAQESIDSGHAQKALEMLVKVSKEG
ncbi:MAG: anthranilate phosphoribosyltransferase [Kiritimatiellae bacterium]|nr:anthranilate phosphoribosyltransferase [Kiritimatiellia bacterium]MDD5520433.1 anthranilate phosphoribosyltransferase [Kiritimatiellia bacterium]